MKLRLLILLLFLLPLSAAAVTIIGGGSEVTVGTEPTQLADTSIEIRASTRRHVLVCVPETSSEVYCGGPTVTVGGGVPVAPGACYSVPSVPPGAVWCVASAASPVRVQESY